MEKEKIKFKDLVFKEILQTENSVYKEQSRILFKNYGLSVWKIREDIKVNGKFEIGILERVNKEFKVKDRNKMSPEEIESVNKVRLLEDIEILEKNFGGKNVFNVEDEETVNTILSILQEID